MIPSFTNLKPSYAKQFENYDMELQFAIMDVNETENLQDADFDPPIRVLTEMRNWILKKNKKELIHYFNTYIQTFPFFVPDTLAKKIEGMKIVKQLSNNPEQPEKTVIKKQEALTKTNRFSHPLSKNETNALIEASSVIKSPPKSIKTASNGKSTFFNHLSLARDLSAKCWKEVVKFCCPPEPNYYSQFPYLTAKEIDQLSRPIQNMQSFATYQSKEIKRADKWKNWSAESFENQLGYFFRILKQVIHTLTNKKKSLKEALKMLPFAQILGHLNNLQLDSPFFSLKYFLIDQINDLKMATSLQEIKQIENDLLKDKEMNQLILEDLKKAIEPVMYFLEGDKNIVNSRQIIQLLENVRSAMRRWQFIEGNQRFNGQEDPMECLERIHHFLEQFQEQSIIQSSVKTFQEDEKDEWVYEDLNQNDYIMLGEKWVKKEHGTCFLKKYSEQELEYLGRVYETQLVQKGSLEEDLNVLKETLALHQETVPFSPFINVTPKNGELIEAGRVENLLPQIFSNHTEFECYEIVDQKIQKIYVPVKERKILFKGTQPTCFILKRQPIYNEKTGRLSTPPLTIPSKISFNSTSYILTLAVERSGYTDVGHYVTWLHQEGIAVGSDSLKKDFYRTEQNLSKLMSQKSNIFMFIYCEQDQTLFSNLKIEKKLMQAPDDELCYLAVVMQSLFNNPLFKELNNFQDSLTSSACVPSIVVENLFKKSPEMINANFNYKISAQAIQRGKATAFDYQHVIETHLSHVWGGVLSNGATPIFSKRSTRLFYLYPNLLKAVIFFNKLTDFCLDHPYGIYLVGYALSCIQSKLMLLINEHKGFAEAVSLEPTHPRVIEYYDLLNLQKYLFQGVDKFKELTDDAERNPKILQSVDWQKKYAIGKLGCLIFLEYYTLKDIQEHCRMYKVPLYSICMEMRREQQQAFLDACKTHYSL